MLLVRNTGPLNSFLKDDKHVLIPESARNRKKSKFFSEKFAGNKPTCFSINVNSGIKKITGLLKR